MKSISELYGEDAADSERGNGELMMMMMGNEADSREIDRCIARW